MAVSFQIHGRVQAVYYDKAGSTVVADQAPGASVITLNDVYDFDETGGTALNTTTNETVTYTALDDTAGTLTLSGVTATTWSAEDFVAPGDGTGQDKRLIASVQDVDEGDVDARIPLRWFDVLAEGTRGINEGEAVVLDYDEANGEYVLTDILGDTPGVDGTFLNPGSVPTSTATSDGHPPASSPAPTVQAGIDILFVRWTPLVNADPVTYEVHVSLTNGFTPAAGDGTTAGSILGGGAFTIKTDPGTSSPLQYNTTYYVRIIAIDADGAATYSAQASGSPVQVDGTLDVIANSITAGSILAQTITADLLSAVLTLSSTIETAATGQRVQIDPTGITLYAADESVVVQLPTTTVGGTPTPAVFNGQVNATAINVFTACTIFGSTGLLVEPNSHLQLVGGQGDPSIAPSATFSYPSVYNLAFNVDGNTVTGSRVSHYSATGGSGGATACYYGTLDTITGAGLRNTYAVEWRASDGHILRQGSLVTGSAGTPVGMGACLVGSEIIAVYITAANSLQFRNFARATFTVDSTVTASPNLGSSALDPNFEHVVALGCDGTNPWLFSYNGSSNLPTRMKCTLSGGQATGAFTSTADFSSSAVKFHTPGDANNLGDAGGPTNVVGAAWDGSANWYVAFSWGNSGGSLQGRVLQQYVQATGAIVAKQEIYLPFIQGYFGGGILYDGTDYFMAGGGGVTTFRRIKGSSALTWDYTLGTAFGIGYTWYNSGAGTPHTAVSPVLNFSLDSGITKAPYQRAQVIVSLPSLPSLATNNLLYAKVGSTTASALLLQAATTYASTDTLQSITFNAYNSGGAVNGNGNVSTFVSGGTPAYMKGDATGMAVTWMLDSSGIFAVPTGTAAQALALAKKGTIARTTDTGILVEHDGVTLNTIGGPTDEIELLRRKLFDAAGVAHIILARNFDPALGVSTANLSSSGATRYYAVYWPGGTCTGMYYLIITSAGAYTDANGRSGSALYSTNGTTLTRQATLNTVLSEGVGIRKRTWTSPASNLAAGIYYVAVKLVFSAGSPTLGLGAINTSDTSTLGNDANNAVTPNSWALANSETDATVALPSTKAISGLAIPASLSWVGLY